MSQEMLKPVTSGEQIQTQPDVLPVPVAHDVVSFPQGLETSLPRFEHPVWPLPISGGDHEAQKKNEKKPLLGEVLQVSKKEFEFRDDNGVTHTLAFRRTTGISSVIMTELIRHAGRTTPREALMKVVTRHESGAPLGVSIFHLRQQLLAIGVDPEIIETVGERGANRGYRLRAKKVNEFQAPQPAIPPATDNVVPVGTFRAKPEEERDPSVLPSRMAALRLILDNPDATLRDIVYTLGPSEKTGRYLNWTQAKWALENALGRLYGNIETLKATPGEEELWETIKQGLGQTRNRTTWRTFKERIGASIGAHKGEKTGLEDVVVEIPSVGSDDNTVTLETAPSPIDPPADPVLFSNGASPDYAEGEETVVDMTVLPSQLPPPLPTRTHSSDAFQVTGLRERQALAVQLTERYPDLSRMAEHWIDITYRTTGGRPVPLADVKTSFGISAEHLPVNTNYGALDLIVGMRRQEAHEVGIPLSQQEIQTLRRYLKLKIEQMLPQVRRYMRRAESQSANPTTAGKV